MDGNLKDQILGAKQLSGTTSQGGGPGEKGATGRERWTPSSGEQLAGHKVNVSRQIASDGDHETR